MIIYNVTTKVEHSIATEWLQWLRKEYIPAMIDTGCFTKAVILHITEADDDEGMTYAVQYHGENEQRYTDYLQRFAGQMAKKAIDKWGNKFISFRTLMNVVN
jgi:hypothetical protein